TRRDRDAVDRALERTGVDEFAHRRLTTLSGGELQRVQIAVGLAQEAPVLIADEPTSHLDLGATATVARLLRGLADDGLAVVLVVHDLALAAAVADSVVVMDRGRTAASGTPEAVLTPERLRDVWRVDARLDGGALHVDWLRRSAAYGV
ncbi:MAG TPA: ABC transporter ATP-binding protein, partial [Solirubrobacter sp.]|nr:ABC transporter ATP-binding protein [Solirubrobacter sp.]